MRVSLLTAGVLTGASLIGCAVPTPTDQDPSISSSTAAIIVVERSSGPGDAVRGDVVTARFVRASQGVLDDPALRIAGVAEDIAMTGTCTVPPDNTPTQGRAVELLDVGQVTVDSQQAALPTLKTTQLMPRSMPDPAGFVSGVFYSSRSNEAFTPSARVSLHTTGGPSLDPLNVSVTAPRDVTDVRVTATPTGVDVSWDASDADARDLVYVDVLSPAPHIVARCTGADTGHLVVSTTTDEGQLAIHRLHKEAFKAKGIEPGEIRFDVAKIVTFRR